MGSPSVNTTFAQGLGNLNLSQLLASQNDEYETSIGKTGIPVFDARITGPLLILYLGPRGPSGVMATLHPESKNEMASRKAAAPRLDDDPLTVRIPK